MPLKPVSNLVGEVVGEFTVASYVRHGLWLCVCSCGSERRISSTDLMKGKRKSCGCKKSEYVSQSKIKHGHAPWGRCATPTYRSWAAMIDRCTNDNNKRWHRYGGRGITVCDQWRYSFQSFLDDMGEKPARMTLDRIDNDGNYEPKNCRWATSKTQGRSNYRARMIEAFGRKQLLVDWALETGLLRETIARRLNAGWPAERALSVAPLGSHWRDRDGEEARA